MNDLNSTDEPDVPSISEAMSGMEPQASVVPTAVGQDHRLFPSLLSQANEEQQEQQDNKTVLAGNKRKSLPLDSNVMSTNDDGIDGANEPGFDNDRIDDRDGQFNEADYNDGRDHRKVNMHQRQRQRQRWHTASSSQEADFDMDPQHDRSAVSDRADAKIAGSRRRRRSTDDTDGVKAMATGVHAPESSNNPEPDAQSQFAVARPWKQALMQNIGAHPQLPIGNQDSQQEAYASQAQSSEAEVVAVPESKQTYDLAVKELNDLSVKQRDKVYDDIHGVSKIEAEEPSKMNFLLRTMRRELSQMSPSDRQAHDQAMGLNESFVEDRAFAMSFLRADNYDSSKAARRMCNYFKEKSALFGQDRLAQPITLRDLDPKTSKILESGCVQVLAKRDSASRAVICVTFKPSWRYGSSIPNILKMLWYMACAMPEDPENQLRAPVLVLYAVGDIDFADDEQGLFRDCGRLFHSMPLRLSSIHGCFNNEKTKHFLSIIMAVMGPSNRARFRSHEESHERCQEMLMTFGIPVSVMPWDIHGNIKVKEHLKWIARREIKETSMLASDGAAFAGIDLPTTNDVLFGRGKPYQQHPGNIYLLELIRSNQEQYNNTERGSKSSVGKLVVDKARRDTNARFLQRRDDGWWFEVPSDVAIEKVCYSFRNFRTRDSGSR